jgi:hypothetical protein
MRFGKSLDLPRSFQRFEFFARPAAFYLILKYDAKVSLFEVSFDVSSESIHAPLPIREAVTARDVRNASNVECFDNPLPDEVSFKHFYHCC